MEELLKGKAGIGGHLVPFLFQKPSQPGKALRLGKGFAAGKGDAAAEGIALDDLQNLLLRHLRTAPKLPGLRIMASRAVMGTALAEHGCPNARAVYNTVSGDASQIKHPC